MIMRSGRPLEALGDVVGDHDERVLVADLLEQPVEDVDGARVEARVRLVEQQHARAVQHGPRDGEPLPHALGEGAHDVVAGARRARPARAAR